MASSILESNLAEITYITYNKNNLKSKIARIARVEFQVYIIQTSIMFSPSLTRNTRSKRLLEQSTNYSSSKKFKSPFPIIPSIGTPDADGDSDDDGGSSPFKFPKLFGGGDSNDVYTERNHIFFKTDVTRESINKLAQEIDNLNHKLATMQRKSTLGNFTPKPIYLHITTNGGDLLAGFFAYDKIKASRVPIHTVIEGGVASAGSIMSIAGTRRYMTPNSHLLIHQLRTGMFGTYEELVDENNIPLWTEL